jgi:hypothetical protein
MFGFSFFTGSLGVHQSYRYSLKRNYVCCRVKEAASRLLLHFSLPWGFAIEHTNRALANCLERYRSAISHTEIGNRIQERQQALAEFQELRKRLSDHFSE